MAIAAAVAAASAALSSLHLSRRPRFRTIPRVTSEFNISFAPSANPKNPKPLKSPSPDLDVHQYGQPDPLFIPWIVRDENGNLTLQTTPPARFLHAMAESKTQLAKKKTTTKMKKKKENSGSNYKVAASAEPKYSKAARRFYNQNFRDPPQRLSKVLAAAGVASRRNCEELIFGGHVTVNGSVCSTPQTRVDPARDIIYVKGNRISKKLPPKVYLALYKPKGYICSSGEKEDKSVMCLFDDYMKGWDKRNPGLPKPRLFTVGRLDVATTGLIIVTNDGEFAQKLSHPSSKLSKEYIAAVVGVVNKRHLIDISEGTFVDGVRCVPDSVELLPRQPDILRHRLRIVVHEGRNHEVRELVKNAGLQIHSLKRVRIGGFRLPSDLG
ncbi:putative ribosomal large subunit pseudouridine synthase SVR1, chloroplastic isoform X2 [Malania oleifera]|nr:putative ribosomal large subunit pseudouridine synthase SVR1, chloroplastic isoform X2 [Malania oleifera]